MTDILDFKLLGPIEVRRKGQLLNLGGPKQRAVLAYLLFRSGQLCSVDELVEAIWGDQTIRRSDTVLVYLAKLRKALDPARTASPPGIIETVRPGYRIIASVENLDTLAFESHVSHAQQHLRAGEFDDAETEFDRALALWRGSPAADLEGLAFVEEQARVLGSKRRIAETERLELLLRCGAAEAVLEVSDHLVAEDPYDERVRALQMVALYRLGRQRQALSVYQDLSTILRDELGISPTRELQELELRILQQDPELLESSNTDTTTVTVRGEAQSQPGAELVNLDDGTRHVVDRSVTTFGRLTDRTIHVADERASRRHAELRRTPTGFRLVDMGSTNGTQVNGETVAEADLSDGDTVTIGDITFRFESVESNY